MANLITVEEYRAANKLNNNTNDPKLNILITSVSQLIKSYLGHSVIDFYTTDKVQTTSASDFQEKIFLDEWPILSITSITEKATFTGAATALTEGVDFYVNSVDDSVIRIDGDLTACWSSVPGGLVVTYKGGYTTTPEDLKLAVFDLVTYYEKDEYKTRRTIGNTSMENINWDKHEGFPEHIKRVLDLYRNVI